MRITRANVSGGVFGKGLGFAEDLTEGFGNPPFSRRSVVAIVCLAVLEEFGEIAAASITEEGLPGLKISADHIGDLRQGAFLEFHSLPEPQSYISQFGFW